MGKYADALIGAAPTETADPGAGKYSSQLLGAPEIAQSAPMAANPEGWGEWIKNSIRGRQDPKEAGTGTVYEQFPSELRNPTANAAIMGAGDEGMADIIQKNLGDKFVRREADANGYPVIVSRGQQGQEQRGYVNKPGLDLQDVSRGIYGSLPYAVTGGAAGAALKSAGVGLNALAQGGTAAATSLAGDVGAGMQGADQGIDVPKAAMTGALGVAGPAVGAGVGALWRKLVTVPGLFDEAAGTLTAKGVEAAKRAGINPDDVTADFAKSFATNLAKTGDEAAAATRAGVDRFGIPATKGQVTKDPYLLTQEEGMRRRLYGESAQDTMRGFDAKQQEAVRFAALGDDGSGSGARGAFAPKQGIAETLAPGRQPGQFSADRTAADLGLGVKSGFGAAKTGAKQMEREAWKGVKDLAATPEALQILPERITKALTDAGDTAFTDAGKAAAELVTKFASGEAPEIVAGAIKLPPIQSVDQMRRGLGRLVKSAATPEDSRQAGIIYDAFNDWIGEAAQKNLLAGDPAKALQIVKARGFTKEVRELFEPRNANGMKSPAASRLAKIENADSGESVVQALFGSQGSRGVADGAVQTLSNFRTALNRYAPQVAEQTWNDVRLAHWSRLVTGKNGELVGPQAMANNIKSAMSSSKSVFEQLYKPAEQRQIKEFVRALEVITYKPPNASGSGYAAASFAKEGVKRLLDAFGVGRIADAALQFSGVSKAMNSAAARQAVQQIARPVRPNVTPVITGMGNALYNGQDSGGR